MDHIKQRRKEARAFLSKIQKDRLSLSSPIFNLREIAKQLLLLEDHLLHTNKHCNDCIRKHLLTTEALADEGIMLDVEGRYVALFAPLSEIAREWMAEITDHLKSPQHVRDVAQQMRFIRKALMPMVHDPRGSVVRVASLWQQREQHICEK